MSKTRINNVDIRKPLVGEDITLGTGINILNSGSGTNTLGTPALPFNALYANNVFVSGGGFGVGTFVHITGETMTGSLTLGTGASLFSNGSGVSNIGAPNNPFLNGYVKNLTTSVLIADSISGNAHSFFLPSSGGNIGGNVSFTGSSDLIMGAASDIILSSGSDILPTTSGTSNLGSATNPFGHIFGLQFTNPSGAFVLLAGDTMTGDLNIQTRLNVGSGNMLGGIHTITMGSLNNVTGNNSFAGGISSFAAGNAAYSFGSGTTASGNFTQALGSNTKALGISSHAEGDSSTSFGQGSHAEGSTTVASGTNSHAEGNSTTTIGDYSHAEGAGGTAYGVFSHVEGDTTTSFGDTAHAEGSNTVASGTNSHAEGELTQAIQDDSHAEGHQTIAYGYSSHAEGESTLAFGAYSHAEGNTTIAGGDYSHAQGFGSVASGTNAHAEGNTSFAMGDNAHAEGSESVASAFASHAEGANTIAGGPKAHSEGTSAVASGNSAHAEGGATIAFGDFSHAEGNSTFASGTYSHAEGLSAVSIGSAAHAEGFTGKAAGDYSHTEGYDNYASGLAAHAEGSGRNWALGEGDHAQGSSTKAHSELVFGAVAAHAEGFGTQAFNHASHAQGDTTIASGIAAFAAGRLANALHNYSIAFADSGGVTTTTGNQFIVSFVQGLNLYNTPLLPAGSGTHNIGASGNSFDNLYVKNIITTGGSSPFVHTSGDKMTGSLTIDSTNSASLLVSNIAVDVPGNNLFIGSGSNNVVLNRNGNQHSPYIRIDNSDIITLSSYVETDIESNVFLSGNMTPYLNNASNLGIPSTRFSNIYAVTGNFVTLTGTSQINIATSLIPTASGNVSLGTVANPFSGTFTSKINNRVVTAAVYNEVPTGTTNGINVNYFLAQAPYNNSLQLFKNGIYMALSGIGANTIDYSLSGTVITFVSAPASGSSIIGNYVYLS